MPLNDKPVNGDYVLASKYADGDPGDQYCIGFYVGSYDHYGQTRHLVIDSAGVTFRRNGFRRVQKVSLKRGNWLVNHIPEIEALARTRSRKTLWGWLRVPMVSQKSSK